VIPLLLLASSTIAASAAADPQSDAGAMIPENIRAMIDAAIASGNDTDVAVVVKYARAADPLSGDAVQAIADKWRADRTAAREAVIRSAGFLNLWTGKAELGGFITTGNSETAGGSAVLDLNREGLQWRHKFHAQADYQESLGVTTREHYLASYEPNYKFGNRAYAYGSAQYESDRFLGYTDRLAVSAGAGYSAIKSSAIQLDLELGPAFRQTAFTDDTEQSSIAGRGTLDFRWRILGGLSLRQQASAYVERYNSTVTGTTALNAKLIGPLSAQFSYNFQYESLPPAGRKTTDTISRASLVYAF
jgi:putative salt-induced outer membrane protein